MDRDTIAEKLRKLRKAGRGIVHANFNAAEKKYSILFGEDYVEEAASNVSDSNPHGQGYSIFDIAYENAGATLMDLGVHKTKIATKYWDGLFEIEVVAQAEAFVDDFNATTVEAYKAKVALEENANNPIVIQR